MSPARVLLLISIGCFPSLAGIVLIAESRVTANTMRYAKHNPASNISPQTQLTDLEQTSSGQILMQPYRVQPYKAQLEDEDKFHEGRFLDEEDKRLLDKFYRETKSSDPFLSDDLSTESLWDEERENTNHANRAGALQGQIGREHDGMSFRKDGEKRHEHATNGWTFDERIVGGNDGNLYQYSLGPAETETADAEANYTPSIKLLTSYLPIGGTNETENISDSKPSDLFDASNRIVGATLFGTDQNAKPSVSSKSATEAIRLHNDLLKKPPNDGKVRVRMYFHRAIHDDAKLYGTGPWKFWAHGWGLEFGYDPRKSNKDFYQRGYTIERAFGRDFCKDNKNCRKPDPEFFRNLNDAGKYSKEYINGIRRRPLLIKDTHIS